MSRLSVTRKLFESHLVSGNMKAGEELALKVDQTLTQDATGTLVILAFEAILPQVRPVVQSGRQRRQSSAPPGTLRHSRQDPGRLGQSYARGRSTGHARLRRRRPGSRAGHGRAPAVSEDARREKNQDIYGRLQSVNLTRDTVRGHIFGVFVEPHSGPAP